MNIKSILVCPVVEGHHYTVEIGEEFNEHQITSLHWEDPSKLELKHDNTTLGYIIWVGNSMVKVMLFV